MTSHTSSTTENDDDDTKTIHLFKRNTFGSFLVLIVAFQKYAVIHTLSHQQNDYVIRYLKICFDTILLLGLVQQLLFPISYSVARISIGTLMIISWLVSVLTMLSLECKVDSIAFFYYLNWLTIGISLLIFATMFFEPNSIISLILPYRVLNRKIKKTDEELLDDAVIREKKKNKKIKKNIVEEDIKSHLPVDGIDNTINEDQAIATATTKTKVIPKITIQSPQ